MSITPVYPYPGLSLFPWQRNLTDSPRSPRASALLSSLPLRTGQGMKPQTPTPPPHSRGFIEGDLLMKTRPQSLSVWSSLPETGIAFTALSPFQSCHCKIHPAGLDVAPWRGWGQPFGVPAGSGIFQSDGCPLQTEPQCRGPKANSHLAPKSGGVWKAQAPGTGLADGYGFAHLLSTFPNAQLRVGHGIQVGAQGLWHISLHAWRWGRPQHRLGTDSITPQSRRLWLGKGEAAGRLFPSPCQEPWEGTGLDRQLGQHSRPPFPGPLRGVSGLFLPSPALLAMLTSSQHILTLSTLSFQKNTAAH